ncbi:MAG: glycosyltransferase [Bdellovibrionales bacterium]
MNLRIVVCGLSITSSWGNGHATTYRSLLSALKARGHSLLFLECDRPWYASNRDLPHPECCTLGLYSSVEELKDRFTSEIARADVVIVGSYVPDGIEVGEFVVSTARGVKAFYDIDTPVTLARLDQVAQEDRYLSRELIAKYDLYLSFTGGPVLRLLETEFGSPRARALYCSVDPQAYFPESLGSQRWDLGYLGTYSEDRQPTLNKLLLQPALEWSEGRFIIAGAQYPEGLRWPPNVAHSPHCPPSHHRAFYNEQRFTLNVTRADMIQMGHSPSVRLFEAAACGTPIISDDWPGLGELFEKGRDIFVAKSANEVLSLLRDLPENERRAVGERARQRVLSQHTSAHRAGELESYLQECFS